MRTFLLLCIVTILASCGEREARRPVSQKSGSYIKESVQRNKNLIAKEEKYISSLIDKDTLQGYEASPYGFWFTYVKKNDTLSKPTPQVGDLVLFNYDLQTLGGDVLLSKEEIGNTVTQIDQSNQELITGIREGLKLMKEGETVTFLFPSHKAYGYYGFDNKVGSNIPIRSTVTLLEIKNKIKN